MSGNINSELYKAIGSDLITAHMLVYLEDERAEDYLMGLYDKIANYLNVQCLDCVITANNPADLDPKPVAQPVVELGGSDQSQSESIPRLRESREEECSQPPEE